MMVQSEADVLPDAGDMVAALKASNVNGWRHNPDAKGKTEIT
jgi:hypothetical protein